MVTPNWCRDTNNKSIQFNRDNEQEIRGDIIEGIREDIRDGVRGDIKGDDIAKALGHMDEDGSYIKKIKYKPYDGPVCETPWCLPISQRLVFSHYWYNWFG